MEYYIRLWLHTILCNEELNEPKKMWIGMLSRIVHMFASIIHIMHTLYIYIYIKHIGNSQNIVVVKT